MPASTARTLTAWPRRSGGASSTIKAVATPPTMASKQTATIRINERAVKDGANALAKLATEKPVTPIAIRRRRPKRSASVASGSAPSAPNASTDPRLESPGISALKSDAIAGRARTSTEPSKAVKTTASPAQSSVRRCRSSSSNTRMYIRLADGCGGECGSAAQALSSPRSVGCGRGHLRAAGRPGLRVAGPERLGEDERGQDDRRPPATQRRQDRAFRYGTRQH